MNRTGLIGLLLICFMFCGAWGPVTSKSLKIIYNKGIAPIKFTTRAGEPSGILNEYWQLLAKKAGLTLEFIEVDSFTESLEMVKNGQADLHAGGFYTDERSKFRTFSKPIFDLKYYLYATADLTGRDQGLPVGDCPGGYTENFIRKTAPR